LISPRLKIAAFAMDRTLAAAPSHASNAERQAFDQQMECLPYFKDLKPYFLLWRHYRYFRRRTTNSAY